MNRKLPLINMLKLNHRSADSSLKPQNIIKIVKSSLHNCQYKNSTTSVSSSSYVSQKSPQFPSLAQGSSISRIISELKTEMSHSQHIALHINSYTYLDRYLCHIRSNQASMNNSALVPHKQSKLHH